MLSIRWAAPPESHTESPLFGGTITAIATDKEGHFGTFVLAVLHALNGSVREAAGGCPYLCGGRAIETSGSRLPYVARSVAATGGQDSSSRCCRGR